MRKIVVLGLVFFVCFSQVSAFGAQCSTKDSPEQCRAVKKCVHKGGSQNYCEMWFGASDKENTPTTTPDPGPQTVSSRPSDSPATNPTEASPPSNWPAPVHYPPPVPNATAMAKRELPLYEIKPKYDKFKDVTTFESEYMPTGAITDTEGRPSLATMKMAAGVRCRGDLSLGCPLSASSEEFLVFTATTMDWSFANNRELILLIDGRPLKVGTLSWDGQVLGADDLREYLGVDIAPSLLSQLAKADSVEAQLGIFEFKFTEENLVAFKELNVHLLSPNRDSESTAPTASPTTASTSHEPQSLGAFGLSRNKNSITITRIVPGGPAQRAGLAVGDRITAINGTPVKQVSDESELFSNHTEVRVSYIRGTIVARRTLLLGSTSQSTR